MKTGNIQDIYELTPVQQGLLFHSLYAPETAVYFVQLCYSLRGKINVVAFERAWQEVVDRHTILRTAFYWEDLEKPLQIVNKNVTIVLQQYDWRDKKGEEQKRQLRDFLESDRAKGFDFSQAPLMRLSLIRCADDIYYFIWSKHHLILDGWSTALVLKEVVEIYQVIEQGKKLPFASKTDYKDYIKWLQKQDLSLTEVFWRQLLSGFKTPNLINNFKGDRVSNQEKKYESQSIKLSKTTTEILQSFARSHKLTLNTIVQGAWAILLSHYSSQEDVVFGVTISGRPTDLLGAESMVGMFINTLPIRVKLKAETPLLSWLVELQNQQLKIYQYQHSSLVDIQNWSEPEKGLSLFESIFVFENYPIDESLKEWQGSLEIQSINVFDNSNYPLTITIIPSSELEIAIAYDCDRFETATINRMLGHFQTLLEQMSEGSEVSLKDLTFLTAAEQHQLLREWNDTKTEYPKNKCIHQLFEKQVKKTPDAIAVVFEEQHLTYRELNNRANQLARYLQKLGVKPEVMVGICSDRSLEMSIAILGVLKAGGAYIPVDPNYPTERITEIFKDAQVSVILTQQHLETKLSSLKIPTVHLDRNWSDIIQESTDNCWSEVNSENLAYVIYTSGSTGKPKGVAVTHQALVNYTLDIAKQFELHINDKILQFASLGFDVVVEELFPTWSIGATVVLLEHNQLISCREFQQLIKKQQITLFELPTAYWHQWVSELLESHETVPSCVRLVIVGGERISREILRQWQQFKTPLIHVYGLTETTVTSTVYRLNKNAEPLEEIELPIGKPIANTQIYILNSHLQPVPVGVEGEIYIGGVGIARGYLNRETLTAERFIPNPFSDKAGSRLYRTGDKARYLSDGNIEYIGRIDHQVKFKGFRIELGEIEAVLTQHRAVASVVVILWQDNPSLVAYVTLRSVQRINAIALRQYLESKLPNYMVPNAFVILPAMPLTPNGKVDRKALPAPDASQISEEKYLAPVTPLQQILAGIWQEILGVEKVGVRDNFFEMGGHSLIATRVASKIRQALNIELPLRSLFEKPTIANLAQEIETATKVNLGLESSVIQAISRLQEIPLSFAQQRLWFIAQLEPDNPSYNQSTVFRLSGQLNIAVLQQSLEELVRRHEPLRTTFNTTPEGKAVQVINQAREFLLPVINLEKLDTFAQEQEIHNLATQEAQRAFNLEQDSMIRVTLVRLNSSEHIVLFTTHHIVCDEWSIAILVKEIATLYQAYLEGKPLPLPELPIQYADFAVWQRQWLQGKVLSSQLDYWCKQLQDVPRLDLPTDYPRPATTSYKAAVKSFTLSKSLTAAIKALSRQEGVTLFMTLLAAFQTLLHRYTRQDEIVVGTPIANRNRTEIEGLIGFFVNTLVLKTNCEGNPSFSELLERVREVTLEAYSHQDIPFEQLVDELKVERHLNRNPLFDVMFAIENGSTEELTLPGLTLSPLSQESEIAIFDLAFRVTETEQELAGSIKYRTDLFDGTTIEQMLAHFQVLLEGIIANPEQKLSELPLLTLAEQQLLKKWNQTEAEYPQHKCIHQLFEERVELNSDAMAVVFEESQVTYRELNDRANQLAHYLQKWGIRPEMTVGIYLERSLEMVVAILAILKVGGAYLPLDPNYPTQRLAFMLQDARTSVILSQSKLASQLPTYSNKIVYLDRDWEIVKNERKNNLNTQVFPDNTSYILYTSGSTGKPKAVVIEHRNTVAFLSWVTQIFDREQLSGVLASTSICFDLSVFELFAPLSCGGTIILAQNALSLPELPFNNRVTLINTVPSAIAELVRIKGLPASIQTVNLAGERLHNSLVKRIDRQNAIARVFNLYGPSEDTTYSTFALLQNNEKAIAIGRPISNTQIYILDSYLQPVPVGKIGELYIAGTGLARGYLNRPGLTASRFIPNPFSSKPGSRLYKTGDLARFLPDGNIEYIGRTDHQIKLRGFRIELGEIETQLDSHPQVTQAVVEVREDFSKRQRLVAYVVCDRDVSLSSNELRSYLKEYLPKYSIPSVFLFLDSFPLTPNGKIDRKALPAPDLAIIEREEIIAPRTSIEETLVKIWTEVLQVNNIGVRDNFFELGGDSIISLQVIAKAKSVNLLLTPKQIFEHQTIAELATVAKTTATQTVDQGLVTGTLFLTPIQHQFFEQKFTDSHHWNQSVMLEVEECNPILLEKSLQHLWEYHDVLRSRFVETESGWQAIIQGLEKTVPFAAIDLSKLHLNKQKETLETTATKLQSSLNLTKGQLIRIVWFNLGKEQPSRLLIIIHHLIVDGVSWRILLKDLETIYQQLIHDKTIKLPAKTTSYKQWSKQLQKYAQTARVEKELDYWLNLSSSNTPFPKDFVEGDNTVASAAIVSITLTEEETQALLYEVPSTYQTQINDVLLSALVQTFQQWTGNNSLLIELEGHGREDILKNVELSRTVGWFTIIFPVVLKLGTNNNPGEILKTIKEQLRNIPHRGINYGVLRYLNKNKLISKQLQKLPQAEIRFNYLGQFDRVISNSIFQPAKESTGVNQSLRGHRDCLLEINGSVSFSQLRLDWNYSKTLYQETTIQQLAQSYLEKLRSLISHCQSPDSGGYTPSDFSEFKQTQWNEDDLEAITAAIRGM